MSRFQRHRWNIQKTWVMLVCLWAFGLTLPTVTYAANAGVPVLFTGTNSLNIPTYLQNSLAVLDSRTAGVCTNQLVRALNTNAGPTCSAIQTADLATAAVTKPKLLVGTGALDTNILTLHAFCSGSPTPGQVCEWNGSGFAFVTPSGGAGSTPGGSDTQVQFNSSGSFGGDAGLTFNATTNILTVTGGFVGAVTGNASTASALAADPTDCATGEAGVGINAAGAAQGCVNIATQAELDAHLNDTTAAHAASSIGFTPGGTIAATDVQSAILEAAAEGGGGGGTAVVLDLADNGANESTALAEIATTGDTNAIFTEPAADKLLIDLTKSWPKADALTTDPADCATGSAGVGINAAGVTQGCVNIATQAELDAHEADTTAVHGIANTANLVLTSDARLADARAAHLGSTDCRTTVTTARLGELCTSSTQREVARCTTPAAGGNTALCDVATEWTVVTGPRGSFTALPSTATAGDTFIVTNASATALVPDGAGDGSTPQAFLWEGTSWVPAIPTRTLQQACDAGANCALTNLTIGDPFIIAPNGLPGVKCAHYGAGGDYIEACSDAAGNALPPRRMVIPVDEELCIGWINGGPPSDSDVGCIHNVGVAGVGTSLTKTGVFNEAAAHVADTTAAHAASAVSFAPTGTIAATTVQAAIAEVATDARASGNHLLIFGCQDATADATDPMFLFYAQGIACTGTETAITNKFGRSTRSGTLKNMFCTLGVAPGAGNSAVLTARLAAVNTAVTCTITHPATTCDSGALSAAYTAMQSVSIQHNPNVNYGVSPNVSCALEVEY